MPRFVSGFFTRDDAARPRDNATVRVLSTARKLLGRAELLRLGTTELELSGIDAPALGTELLIAITIPERFIEFEVPAVVTWSEGQQLRVKLAHLSARQAYGVSLVRDLRRTPQLAAPQPTKRSGWGRVTSS